MASGDVSVALGASPDRVGPALLALPEDQWFERKSGRIEPRRLAEAVVGFANADGGVIVVGLHSGTVEGTRADPRHRNELMQVAMTFTEPTVTIRSTLHACVNSRGAPDELLAIEVPPSTTVHATTRDDVYLRVGDETRRLSFAQRRELVYDKGHAAYESERSGQSLDTVDKALLKNYATRVGAPDAARLLRARGLSVDDELTVGGCLLFCSEPGRVMPNAHIRVTRFAGTTRGAGSRQRLIHDRRVEGPIPRAIMAARDHVRQWQPVRQALGSGGAFQDVALVPEDAWLEGIVNAVVHRAYSLGGDHVHVDIFDDRIEIESPGRFPGLVDLVDPLQTTRFARNPRIARVCADLRIGQELGEGIRRMYEEMRLAGLSDPLYHQTSGSVQLTLVAAPAPGVASRDADAGRIVVAALRQAGRLGTGDAADLLGVTRPTAIRRLRRLRDDGVVEWVGNSPSDPQAYWQLPR